MIAEQYPCGAVQYRCKWFSDAMPLMKPFDVVLFTHGVGDVPHGFVCCYLPKLEKYAAYKRSIKSENS